MVYGACAGEFPEHGAMFSRPSASFPSMRRGRRYRAPAPISTMMSRHFPWLNRITLSAHRVA